MYFFVNLRKTIFQDFIGDGCHTEMTTLAIGTHSAENRYDWATQNPQVDYPDVKK